MNSPSDILLGGLNEAAVLDVSAGANVKSIYGDGGIYAGSDDTPGSRGTISLDNGTITSAISLASGGILTGNGLVNGDIANTGAITSSGGTLTIDGAIGGTGTTTIDSNSVLDVTGAVSGQTIAFADATGTLAIGDLAGFAATLAGFQAGDSLDLSGLTADATSFDQSNGVLTLEDISGTATTDVGTIDLSGSYDPSWFHVADSGGATFVTDLPCFAAGTRIATERGLVPVENLRAGDAVVTHAGTLRPVVWLGHRRVACRRHPRPADVQPVRIAAHAFGLGRPVRDILLSPDHAVFVEGVLIPVRYLLNAATVRQEDVESVTYWHVELDAHDVLLAEGLPAESFLDSGNRAAFANGGTMVQAHPDFALRVWDADSCAPLVLAGPVRDLVYRRLLAQAFALGWRAEAANDGATTWVAPGGAGTMVASG